MTRLLVDSSVLLKWFHEEGESEVAAARALRDAHIRDELDAHVLDLGLYEIGSVLVRAKNWSVSDVIAQLEDLDLLLGAPLVSSPSSRARAAELAQRHRLTYYDAAWVAAAEESGAALVSADRALLAADLAESPTACAERLRLRPG